MAWYTEKVGPFPAYVYVGAAGIGLGVMIIRSRSQQRAAQDAAIPLDMSTTAGIQPGGGGAITLPNNATSTLTATPTIATNNDWSRAAASRLIGMGYDPTAVTNALSRYLGGKALSDQENAIAQEALRQIGPAPIPPPAPIQQAPTTPAPPPPASAPPPATPDNGHWPYPNAEGLGPMYGNRGTVTMREGWTLQDVAVYVYGSGFEYAAGGIARANPSYGPNPPVGATLWLPLNPTG